MKKILIAVGIIIARYVSFVTIDCIRLKNAEIGTKPLITLSFEEFENRDKYTGLGYSVEYYKDKQREANGNFVEIGYGAEFRLFDKILLWAWVE